MGHQMIVQACCCSKHHGISFSLLLDTLNHQAERPVHRLVIHPGKSDAAGRRSFESAEEMGDVEPAQQAVPAHFDTFELAQGPVLNVFADDATADDQQIAGEKVADRRQFEQAPGRDQGQDHKDQPPITAEMKRHVNGRKRQQQIGCDLRGDVFNRVLKGNQYHDDRCLSCSRNEW